MYQKILFLFFSKTKVLIGIELQKYYKRNDIAILTHLCIATHNYKGKSSVRLIFNKKTRKRICFSINQKALSF